MVSRSFYSSLLSSSSEDGIHIIGFGWILDKHSTLLATSVVLLRLIIGITIRPIPTRPIIQIRQRPYPTPRCLLLLVLLPGPETVPVRPRRGGGSGPGGRRRRRERGWRRERSGWRWREGFRRRGGDGFEEGGDGKVEVEVVAFKEEEGFLWGGGSDGAECGD